MAASAASRELFTEGVRAVLHTWPVLQVSVRLLQLFSQWQQGALQPLKHTINTLTQNQNQRAKVTAPTSQSDDDSDDGAQGMECEAAAPPVSRSQPRAPQDEDEDGWTLVRKRK
ncbi:pre-rRNA-processing protein TSR2 homolog [Stegastes partitus]|uniref:Pre-rRNA-processing protein TSR2 homolog n=1 Tax=Stegastes partitus TaxID=144197 RepID=A0A9Y4TWB1_9TELE|nr:PREDICTED: pre-rRNA-processing protein TSR2 homolog [Stegastes partitus]